VFHHVGFFIAFGGSDMRNRRAMLREALPVQFGLDAVLAILREGQFDDRLAKKIRMTRMADEGRKTSLRGSTIDGWP